MTDYEKTYNEFWKELVEVDGLLDPDKVKRELHDYHTLIENVPKVYLHVTDGKVSKPNTDSDVVCALADDTCNATFDDLMKARPLAEWHEDRGDVFWWKFPIVEAPYIGSPLDTEWPGDHTHWTEIQVPKEPKV